jgi:hypothetical protein
LEEKCKFKEESKQQKNFPKYRDKKIEKKMKLLMNKNLKVILIIPTSNLFENIYVQSLKSS